MSYIDGYIVPVKTGRKQEYIDIAARMAKRYLANGALRVIEAWGDEVPDGKVTDFKRSVAAESDETIVFSWVEWPSREARDAAWKKLETDPEMTEGMKQADKPFNMQRMIWGGFHPVVDEKPAR